MTSDKLRIERIAADGEQRILRLTGPLTLSTLFAFQDLVRSEPPVATIIDLRGVPYVDSAGLGALVNAFVSHQNSGQAFVLAEVPPRVLSLLAMTKLDSVLPCCDFETAQRHLKQHAPNG